MIFRSKFGECTTKMVGKTRFDEFYKDGLCLCFEPSASDTLVLDCVFLYNAGTATLYFTILRCNSLLDKKYEQYKGKLPHDIDWTMNNAKIVQKCGWLP